MTDVIKEYAIQIQVQGSKAVIKEFKELEKIEKKQNKELKETNSLLWTYAKRLVSIYAIYKLFKGGLNLAVNFAEQGAQLKNLASNANLSTKALQKWTTLVKRYNGSQQTVTQTMGALNSKLYRYNRLHEWEPFLDYMNNFGHYGGIPNTENAEEFLIEISRRLKGLDNLTQNEMLNSLGITDMAMQELLKSNGDLETKLKNAKVIFTDEQIDKAVKVKNLLVDFNTELQKTMMLLGEKFLPALTKILSEVQKFLNNPKGYVIDSLKEAGNHFESNTKEYVKTAVKATGVPLFAKALTNWMLQRDEKRENKLAALGFSDEALKKLAYMNYDLSRYGDTLTSELLLRNFSRDIGNVAVYNDNAININGANSPIQVADDVTHEIISISDHSLALAGLKFATREQ